MAQIKDLSVKTSIGGIYGIESLGTIWGAFYITG
jgi:hypothetical protein